MKSTLKILFLLPIIFVLACSGWKPKNNYKIVLNISVNTYIESLTNGEVSISDSFKNDAFIAATDEEIIDAFIETYTHSKSEKWLLDIFAKNNALPKFKNNAELKQFIFSDYNNKIRRMHEVIINRIYNFAGAPKDKIKIQQTKNQIIVHVSGVDDKSEIEAAFQNRDGINFWEAIQLSQIADYITRLNDTLTSLAPKANLRPIDTSKKISLKDAVARGEMKENVTDVLFKILQLSVDHNGQSYGASFWAIASINDTAKINSFLNGSAYKAIFPENIKMLWGKVPGKQSSPKTALALYAINTGFNNSPLVDGNDIKSAKFDYVNGQAEISIEMNAKGSVKWSNATRQYIGKPIAMEMNNFVLSAPNVNEQITGGRSSITGDFSAVEGSNLALAINSGRFPLDFKLISIEQSEEQK